MKYLINFYILIISLIYPFKQVYCQIDKKIMLLDFSKKEWKEVNIKEDWANQKVYLISYNKNTTDSIEVNNVAEIETTIVFFDRFLKIEYRCNGGSGVHLKRSKIFCLKNGHIYESLSLLTHQESYSSDGAMQEKYWVNILPTFTKSKYCALLTENMKDKKSNLLMKNYTIQFDQEDMIFFSKKNKSKSIFFCPSQLQRKVAYYLISLKKETYINFEGIWYQKGLKCYKKM